MVSNGVKITFNPSHARACKACACADTQAPSCWGPYESATEESCSQHSSLFTVRIDGLMKKQTTKQHGTDMTGLEGMPGDQCFSRQRPGMYLPGLVCIGSLHVRMPSHQCHMGPPWIRPCNQAIQCLFRHWQDMRGANPTLMSMGIHATVWCSHRTYRGVSLGGLIPDTCSRQAWL